mmetsp:Transcript_31295/g.42381  ORF Transcript_31295/g.42381 Transcript_31295/m.42381 type:complete len:82 (-) Transcript_31295:1369-1614(-)
MQVGLEYWNEKKHNAATSHAYCHISWCGSYTMLELLDWSRMTDSFFARRRENLSNKREAGGKFIPQDSTLHHDLTRIEPAC